MNMLSSERQGNRYFLKIEESNEAVEKAIEKAFQKLVKSANVPGFRKGKVPRPVFERYYGSETLYREGIGEAVNTAYVAAVESLGIYVIDYPQNLKVEELKNGEPLVFTCEVEVKPEVTLATYRGVEVKRETTEIKEEDIQAQIDRVREGYADYVEATRSAQSGDILRGQMETTVEGVRYEPWSRQNVGVKVGIGSFGKDFDEQVVGLSVGDKKEFTITYPEDFSVPEVAGKTAQIVFEVSEIREKKLPELSEEFVQKVSSVKTVQEFRDQVKNELVTKASKEAENKFYESLLEAITKDVQVDIQPLLVEREIEASLERLEGSLKESGLTLDQYRTFTKQSVEELKEAYRASSFNKVKTELTLEAIAAKENMVVTDEELIDEIKKWDMASLKNEQAIQRYLDQVGQEVKETLLRQKALKFVEAHAKIA